MSMKRFLVTAALTLGLTTVSARAAETYASPAEHFSFAVPDGLVPLTAAELTRANVAAAAAADGGTPRLYEAGFAPPATAGRPRPSVPSVLVRYVPGRTTIGAFADDYRAALTKAYAAAAAASRQPATGPTTTAVDPSAPAVHVDEAAGVVASERRRPVPGGGTILKRETVYVGRDGVAIVEWSGTPAEADAGLKPMLASFKFDPGFGYVPPAVLKTTRPPRRRPADARDRHRPGRLGPVPRRRGPVLRPRQTTQRLRVYPGSPVGRRRVRVLPFREAVAGLKGGGLVGAEVDLPTVELDVPEPAGGTEKRLGTTRQERDLQAHASPRGLPGPRR